MAKPRKRLIEEVDTSDSPSEPLSTKQKTEESTNSETSYVSAAAAIFSDDSDSEETEQTEVESESELSESSEDPSSGSDDSSEEEELEGEDKNGEEIINVRPGVKPEIRKDKVVGGGLMQRLQSFLPAIEKANQDLEREREDGTLKQRDLENVEDEEAPYIEMVGSDWFC